MSSNFFRSLAVGEIIALAGFPQGSLHYYSWFVLHVFWGAVGWDPILGIAVVGVVVVGVVVGWKPDAFSAGFCGRKSNRRL